MKRLKIKGRLFFSIIVFSMIFTGFFALQGCAGLSFFSVKSSDAQISASANQPDNSGAQNNDAQDKDSDNGRAAGETGNSGSASETQDGTTADSQNTPGAQDAGREPVLITYIGEKNSFAFQYPANNLTLSSNVFVAAGTGNSKLSVMKQRPDSFNSSYYYFDKQKIQEDTAALKEGKFGADIEYSYKPGQRVIEKDGRFLKEFVIFSRSSCDVCFERVVVFYEGEAQHLVILQGDTNTLKESLPDYLVADNKDCQGLPSWGDGKIDVLYNELLTGSAPEKVQQWYDGFDVITAGIVFDSSKIAGLKSNGNIAVIGKSIYDNMPEYKTELTAYYPVFEDFKNAGYFDSVNSHIKDILDPWFAYFMESVKTTLKDMPEDAPWIFALQTDYAVQYYNGNILSLLFTDYAFTGGAHGSTISSTYNYDLANNKEIGLGDIFKPGTDYLNFLSDYCFEDIKRQNILMGMDPMEEMIKPGVDPLVPENFARFVLSADSLIIIFDQYQVGPGAAGSYIVRIGYEEFTEMINEDFAGALPK